MPDYAAFDRYVRRAPAGLDRRAGRVLQVSIGAG